MPARLSYRPIFEHFVTANHRFQSNLGHQKISNSSQLRPPEGTEKSASPLNFTCQSAAPKISKNQQFSTSSNLPRGQPAAPSTASSSSLPRGQQPSQGPASSLPGASQQSSSLPARMELYTYIWIM